MPKVTEKNYKASILMAVISGIYMFGFWMGQQTMKEDYDALQAKFNNQSEKVNTVVVTEYVDRIQEVVKWRTKNVELISVVPVNNCELSDGWVHVHDSSAQASYAEASRAADATPSGVEANQALTTIVENYAVCQENAERLSALQSWVKAQEQVILNINTADAGLNQQEEQ